MNTELCVRAGTHKPRAKYVVVHNDSYKRLGTVLHLDTGRISSANNVGNVLEHLMWLALEENRCEWILGVFWFLLDDGTASDSAGGAPQPAVPECLLVHGGTSHYVSPHAGADGSWTGELWKRCLNSLNADSIFSRFRLREGGPR